MDQCYIRWSETLVEPLRKLIRGNKCVMCADPVTQMCNSKQNCCNCMPGNRLSPRQVNDNTDLHLDVETCLECNKTVGLFSQAS